MKHLLMICSMSLSVLSLGAYADQTPQPTKASTAKQCPDFLNHEYRQLHSTNKINLCSKYTGKPMIIINTASHCGFTHQFSSLEKLYQKYKAQGVEVIGFASNDFNQAAKDEASAAGICFKNYGVTFTMIAPTSVKGDKANPTFAHLGQQTKAPSWNFNKYVVGGAGTNVEHFGSKEKPLASSLEDSLKAQLNKI